jgi:hypothetical protein
MTRFMELYPRTSLFPTFTPEELGLSPTPPRSPLPSNANKDFENTQRDCALFPVYTDYIYGPDARPKPSPSSAALLPQPHCAPLVSIYRRNWIHPEELAYRTLHQRNIQHLMASRPKNNFPQLPGLTTRPARASQASLKQTAVAVMPTRVTRYLTQFQNTTPSPSYSSGRAPAIQSQHALHQGPDFLATPTPQSRKTSQQGPKVLFPGQILSIGCQGISDLEKQNINTRVTMCWSVFRAQDAPHDKKEQSMAYLIHISNQVRVRHSNWMMRDGMRNLWRCVKMTRELPPKDPRHMKAREFVTNFRQKLMPHAAHHVVQALNAMAQAEREGREPFDEVEKYTDAGTSFTSPTLRRASAPPGQYPDVASSVGCRAPTSAAQYVVVVPSTQYVAAAPPVQYPAVALPPPKSGESMYTW